MQHISLVVATRMPIMRNQMQTSICEQHKSIYSPSVRSWFAFRKFGFSMRFFYDFRKWKMFYKSNANGLSGIFYLDFCFKIGTYSIQEIVILVRIVLKCTDLERNDKNQFYISRYWNISENFWIFREITEKDESMRICLLIAVSKFDWLQSSRCTPPYHSLLFFCILQHFDAAIDLHTTDRLNFKVTSIYIAALTECSICWTQEMKTYFT